jgi:uncharacterized protein (TIGR02452 family)
VTLTQQAPQQNFAFHIDITSNPSHCIYTYQDSGLSIMGREAPSVGQPPAAFKKNVRSKKAKATINKVIPALLTTHPRAKRGIDAAELIVQPAAQKTEDSFAKSKDVTVAVANSEESEPHIKLRVADTLSAARDILEDPVTHKDDLSNRNARVGVLNMASMLAPGGGFLNGASSQEESLCMRTTLLPSLSDSFYRLPEVGGVYTPDVLVFRDEMAEDLEKRNRWFVDCVSAGMLRFPSITVDEITGRGSYSSSKDREMVVEKMQAVMRIFQAKSVKKVVIGAWGCGAYGNPVGEIAAAWKKVLLGGRQAQRSKKGRKEAWTGIDTVVFAIKDAGLAAAFRNAFGDGLIFDEAVDGAKEESDEEGDQEAESLRETQEKIDEMKLRIQQARSPELKAGLSSILAGLQGRLPQTSSSTGSKDAADTNEEEADIGTDDTDSDVAYDSTEE